MKRYRILTEKDVLQDGDQFNEGTKRKPSWGPTSYDGSPMFSDMVGWYRRPIRNKTRRTERKKIKIRVIGG